MSTNPKDILISVLDIVEYKDDKKKFINEFLYVSEIEALLNNLSALDSLKQEEVKALIAQDSSDKLQEYIDSHLGSDEIFQKELAKVIEVAFKDFLTEVMPTLREDQKEKLKKYFTSYSTQVAEAT